MFRIKVELKLCDKEVESMVSELEKDEKIQNDSELEFSALFSILSDDPPDVFPTSAGRYWKCRRIFNTNIERDVWVENTKLQIETWSDAWKGWSIKHEISLSVSNFIFERKRKGVTVAEWTEKLTDEEAKEKFRKLSSIVAVPSLSYPPDTTFSYSKVDAGKEE